MYQSAYVKGDIETFIHILHLLEVGLNFEGNYWNYLGFDNNLKIVIKILCLKIDEAFLR